MKFVESAVGFTAAAVVILVLMLNAGVFAYSARASGIQASSSPLDNEHESNSTHASSTQEHTQASSQESTQTTESQDDQNGDQGNGNGHEGGSEGKQLHFTLYSPSSTNNGKDDRGQVSIVINGNTLEIDISVKKTTPSATFSVVLVAVPITSTSTTTTSTITVFSTTMFSTSTISSSTTTGAGSCTGSIGTLVTNGDGEGDAVLSTTLSSGTYALGLVLCANGAPVLVTHPGTRTASVPQNTGGNGEHSESETTTSTTVFSATIPSTSIISSTKGQDDHGDKLNPVTESGDEGRQITSAISNRTIPAVVSVFNSGVIVHQLDSQFSLSASNLTSSGLMISISGQNVTGSRVLLVNLTGSQWSTSSLQSLKVVFDGARISQAASLSQIFNSSSTDPARYVVMLTSSGLQLLVSIPHFSLHTIQIIPTAVTAAGVTSLNGALLLGAIVLLAALSVSVYLKRGKIYSVLK